MLPGPTLETERLILRPTLAEDFDAWAAFMADETSARFLGGVLPRAMAWRSFLTMVGAWQVQGFAMFSVIEKATGRWVGRLGPWVPEGWPGTEVGWGTVRDATGQGYATEGSAAAIDWAFDTLGWTQVVHTIDPDNAPSKGVARKLGSNFKRMTPMPAPFLEGQQIELWGQTREQWRARRKRAPV